MVRRTGLVAACLALLLTSACGGSSRPSVSDVSKGLRTKEGVSFWGDTYTKKTADCMAKVLVGSDLSDEAVTALMDADRKFTPTKDDEAVRDKISAEVAACVPATK